MAMDPINEYHHNITTLPDLEHTHEEHIEFDLLYAVPYFTHNTTVIKAR